ncbi:HAD-IIB family hydrolase [Alloalcanivorax sp. C16-2]|uniref:HAD-IIB family hydrolase n=1 Tax=Alloalcanivorax TaxID=3020832 RepID=UPI0019315235|nr:HAD-IIB family hydrolase [Alloalcanivorax marinus]MBL7250658.1 HAD-IIB family hydrolase [Alloalcanivorax marinus]
MILDRRLLVFTDLDGSLLDHHDYDWSPAAPWLERLAAAGAAVIPVTSKTRAELTALRRELGLAGTPFVAENGAVIGLPTTWRRPDDPPADVDDLTLLTPGDDAASLAGRLHRLAAEQDAPVRLLSELNDAEVAELTGLSPSEAALARRREGSQPLIWDGDEPGWRRFCMALQRDGLTVTRGGRFHHVMGHVDKGRAVRWLAERFRALHRVRPATLGLGDGPNDVPLLTASDRAVLIRGAHGLPVTVPHEHLYRTRHSGPRGWAEGLDHWLSNSLEDGG